MKYVYQHAKDINIYLPDSFKTIAQYSKTKILQVLNNPEAILQSHESIFLAIKKIDEESWLIARYALIDEKYKFLDSFISKNKEELKKHKRIFPS